MASGWPTVEDVKAWLRMENTDIQSDDVIAMALAASIDWVTGRVVAAATDPTGDLFLPDSLFMATVMDAGRLTRRRDSVDGTVGWGDMGLIRVGPKDPDIESKLAQYEVIVV